MTETKRCEYCDDTGDVISQIGEWRGYCTCQYGQDLKNGKPQPTPEPMGAPETEWTEVDLWAEIHRLRAAVKGPDGYSSWQEAATAERIRRVRAEAEIKKRDALAQGTARKLVTEGVIGYIPGISWTVSPKFESEQTIRIFRDRQPQLGAIHPISIGPVEPDMRHPKIQAILGARARLSIELGLVESLLEDPNYETSGTDGDYWGPIHDKIVELQRKVKDKPSE